MKHISRRSFLKVVGASALGTTLAACGEKKAAEGALTKVSVGYMPNYLSLAMVVAAMKTGGFEEQGLEVELVEFADGPTIIATMESGSLQFGYIGPGAHSLAINGRVDIFCMAQVGDSDAVIANKSKGVTTAADLKGKVVAYASGTSSESILLYVLESAGLTMDDITAMEMDASAITTAMISGSVDACATWSPSTMTIKSELGDNALVLGSNKDFLDKAVAISSWIATPTYIEENHDTVISFTKGLYAGMDYESQEENREQNCKWVAELTGLSFESVYEQREDGDWLNSTETLEIVENGDLEAMYQLQQDGFVANGDCEARPVAEYVLFDMMKEAAE